MGSWQRLSLHHLALCSLWSRFSHTVYFEHHIIRQENWEPGAQRSFSSTWLIKCYNCGPSPSCLSLNCVLRILLSAMEKAEVKYFGSSLLTEDSGYHRMLHEQNCIWSWGLLLVMWSWVWRAFSEWERSVAKQKCRKMSETL